MNNWRRSFPFPVVLHHGQILGHFEGKCVILARPAGAGILTNFGKNYKVFVFNESILDDALLDSIRKILAYTQKGMQVPGFDGIARNQPLKRTNFFRMIGLPWLVDQLGGSSQRWERLESLF